MKTTSTVQALATKRARYPWMPMRLTSTFRPPGEEIVRSFMEHLNCDRDEALRRIEAEHGEVWVNDLYQVSVERQPEQYMARLCIRRRDGGTINRDWRHFQRIKNEIIGPECEAVELYPAESRLVDASNKYHLFCCTDPAFRFPFGWIKRDVDYIGGKLPGLRQRPL